MDRYAEYRAAMERHKDAMRSVQLHHWHEVWAGDRAVPVPPQDKLCLDPSTFFVLSCEMTQAYIGFWQRCLKW